MNYNSHQLKKDLIIKRCIQNDMSLDTAAAEIGISKATLSRLEKQKTPDVLTLAKCCTWLGTEPNHYFEIPRQNRVTIIESDIISVKNQNNHNEIKKATN